MVLVQTGLLRSLSISSIRFLFLVNSFLTDFFTSYAGNHQGVQKVAFHQQYAPQQIGLDQWQQLQDTSWSHWSTSKSGKEIIVSDSNPASPWKFCSQYYYCSHNLCSCLNNSIDLLNYARPVSSAMKIALVGCNG